MLLKDVSASKGMVSYTDSPSAALASMQLPQTQLQTPTPINPFSTPSVGQPEFMQHNLSACSDLGVDLC